MFPRSLPLIGFIAASVDHVSENIAVEFFGLLSKLFSCGTVNFVTCQVNSLWMLLDNWKLPVFRRSRNHAVGRLWNYFKSDVLYCRWSGSISVEYGVVRLRKRQLILPTNALDSVSQPFLGGLHASLQIGFLPFDHLRQVNDSIVVPENCEDAFSCVRLDLE